MSNVPATNYPSNLFVNWALKIVQQPCTVIPVKSGAHSSVYKLSGKHEAWFIKIADDLTLEIQKLKWLYCVNISTPKLIAQNISGTPQAILISSIPGSDLAELSETQPKEATVKQLAYALRQLHSVDATKCPFGAYLSGSLLVHGDACLPNVIYKDGILSGFIDLLDMGVGSLDVDLSAAIWSLEFNLGKGYGLMFLEEYGHNVITMDEVNRLYNVYEDSPIFRR